MDTAARMQMGGIGGLGAALVFGFLFRFTPVAFASIPIVLAYVTRTLMLAFALGRVIPLAVGAASIGWLENLQTIGHLRRGFEIVGGILLMVIGVYLLNEYYFWF